MIRPSSLSRLLAVAAGLAIALAARAATYLPLESSVVTEVVNDVSRISLPSHSEQRAVPRMPLKSPDELRTGRDSRAELEAPDGTITRLGANTLFAFDRERREIKLERGSLLFHSPANRGGGTIRSSSASATVLGTTIIASATPDGGFKLLVLEGTARVDYPDGARASIAAGQMTFVRPAAGGLGKPGPVLNFDLQRQIAGSKLVNGFSRPLPSMRKISRAIDAQQKRVGSGQFVATGFLVYTATSDSQVNGIETNGPDSDDRLTGSFTGAERLALNTPAQITGTTLPEARLFTTPLLVPASESAFLNKESDVLLTGLLGQTIIIDTPTLSLAAWHGPAEFQFVGRDSVSFATSTRLVDLDAIQYLRVFSSTILLPNGGTISLAPRTSGTPFTFYLDANNTLAMNGGTIDVASGGLILQSHAKDILLAGATLRGGGPIGASTVVPSAVNLDAPLGLIRLTDSTVTAQGGTLAIAGASVQLQRSTLRTDGDLWIDSAGDLSLDTLALSSRDPASAVFQAVGNGTLDLRTLRFDAFREINLGARTLALQDVHFLAGTTVRLVSQNGMLAPNPNTGAAVLQGYVNFVRDVTYDDHPAQDYVSTTAGGNGGAASPITLSSPTQ